MKCEKCGKKINLNDSYCGECGDAINKDAYYKKIRNKSLKISFTIIILLLVIWLASFAIMYFTSAQVIARKYFNTVISNDESKIYEYIKDDESLFVSEEILKEKNEELGNVENVSISRIYDSNNKTYVEFTYTLNGKNKVSYVELERKSYFNIFNTYKVVSGKVVSNIELIVPKNSSVTIDDTDISSYLQKDKNTYDTYYIKNMIKGTYNIKVTLENGLTIEKELSVENNGSYIISSIELSDSENENIEKISLDSINTLYTSVLESKNYSEISSQFTENLESIYKNIKRNLNNSSITSIKYTDADLESTLVNSDGSITATLLLDYTYTYTNSSNETKTKEATTRMQFTYTYKDEIFTLTNID
jgi:predicted nucleic acid-binding Zn ribbon protein